jgi:RNA polymerase sigma-70 factor (ECF subfamily)
VPLTLESGLIESARSGGAGLERLIVAIWPEAYRIAFSILRDRGLAEDAAQEACATLARSLPTLKDTSVFRAWSYKVIVNHAITVGRRRPRTQTLDALYDRGIQFDQSDALDLYNALAALPVVQRGAIILHYYAGLNSGEIAAATGLPASTVRFHLMLARRALRKALSAVDARTIPPSEEVLSDVH